MHLRFPVTCAFAFGGKESKHACFGVRTCVTENLSYYTFSRSTFRTANIARVFFLGHLCKSTIPLKGRMFLFMSLNQTLTQTHMHKHTSPMFCHWTTAFCTKPFYPLYRQTTSSDAAQKAVLVDSGGFSNFQVGLWKSLLHFNPTQVASRWRGGILMKVSPLQWELRENLL